MTRGIIAALIIATLSGCAEYNAAVSGATAYASGQITIQQQNIQGIDDANAKALAAAACATPYGEVARNGSGNLNFSKAILLLCGSPAGTTIIQTVGVATATTTIPSTTVVAPTVQAQ